MDHDSSALVSSILKNFIIVQVDTDSKKTVRSLSQMKAHAWCRHWPLWTL